MSNTNDSSSSRSGILAYFAEYRPRQAAVPSAHARYVLPTPVYPMIMMFCPFAMYPQQASSFMRRLSRFLSGSRKAVNVCN